MQAKIKKLHQKTEDKLAKERKNLVAKVTNAHTKKGCGSTFHQRPKRPTIHISMITRLPRRALREQAAKAEAKFAKEEQAAIKKGNNIREDLAKEAFRLDLEYRELYRREYLNLVNGTVIEEIDLYTSTLQRCTLGRRWGMENQELHRSRKMEVVLWLVC